MSWLLVIILSTGVVKKTKFNTEDACHLVRQEIELIKNPKFVKIKCIYDKKGRK